MLGWVARGCRGSAPNAGTGPITTNSDYCNESKLTIFVCGGLGRGGGDRTRPPNYKVPWNEGVAAARQIQLLILLTETEDAGCVAVVQTRKERKR